MRSVAKYSLFRSSLAMSSVDTMYHSIYCSSIFFLPVLVGIIHLTPNGQAICSNYCTQKDDGSSHAWKMA